MRIFNSLAELAAAQGEHLGSSDWHEVTQQQIDTFADATGDHQWIHVDPERAKDGPFGTTIAHGFLTLSLAPKFAWEVYEVRNLAMAVNYGCNKVRFPAPVPVGSRLRGDVELVSVIETPSGSQVTTGITVVIEGSDKPACVAEMVAVMIGNERKDS